MSTPSGDSAPFNQQVMKSLQSVGAHLVYRCAICGQHHEGECPFSNGGAATPFVAVIGERDERIDDGVGYDGRVKPDFVARDDAGWRAV